MKTVALTIEDSEGRAVTFKLAPTPMVDLADTIGPILADADSKTVTSAGSEALVKAIFASARRVKSEITVEWLRVNLDLHNYKQVLNAFLEVNNFDKAATAAAGETAPGEAVAAAAG